MRPPNETPINDRETGARKLEQARGARRPRDGVPRPRGDADAAVKPPARPYGLTEPLDDVEEKTRHSEGVDGRPGRQGSGRK